MSSSIKKCYHCNYNESGSSNVYLCQHILSNKDICNERLFYNGGQYTCKKYSHCTSNTDINDKTPFICYYCNPDNCWQCKVCQSYFWKGEYYGQSNLMCLRCERSKSQQQQKQ